MGQLGSGTYKGSGNWTGGGDVWNGPMAEPPTSQAYANELRGLGYQVANIDVSSQGMGPNPLYNITLTIDDLDEDKIYAVNGELNGYFGHFFHNVTINPLDFIAYAALPDTSVPAPLNAQLNAITAGVNAANKTVAPTTGTGTFNKLAADIGVSVGVLGIVAAIAAVVIVKSSK